MNLLKETIDDLKRVGKTPADVNWVGSRDGKMAISWAEFASISDIEYDAGFGSVEIASDLVIVGLDWWLERHEYDGSEEWRYNTRPLLAPVIKTFSKIKATKYEFDDLAEINGERNGH